MTDINGETRSGSDQISAGYKSILLKVYTANQLPADSFRTISIRTENMNGEYQPSTIQVNITKLVPEDRLIRKRYWEQPDQFVMGKEEFIARYTHNNTINIIDNTDESNLPKDTLVTATRTGPQVMQIPM